MRFADAEATAYLSRLKSLFAAARAGAQYVDTRLLERYLSFIGPSPLPARGRQPWVDVDVRSGLPSAKQLRRVFALHQLASDFFRLNRIRAGGKSSSFWLQLAGAELTPLENVEVKLASRHGAERYLVIADGVDGDTGCYVRHTLLVEKRGGSHLGVDRSNQAHASGVLTLALRAIVPMTAERAMISIGNLDGLWVEEATRGQLGPLQVLGIAGPRLVDDALRSYGGGAVLHLSLQRSGAQVPADRIADPWVSLEREPGNHRVSCERRLICTPNVEAPLREALASGGTPLVVRSR